MKIGIIGCGFVGNAIHKSLELHNLNVICYDKYKKSTPLKELLSADIIFMCLPTPYNNHTHDYDKSAIIENCQVLYSLNYEGIILLKSTVEPYFTNTLESTFKLNILHNPEFLSARSAFNDFHNQTHIVLGCPKNTIKENVEVVTVFYNKYYPSATISVCSSSESECMKLYCNSFYAVKIQFFNELYLLSQQLKVDYNVIRDLMLKNNWINPMHTQVPGHDGQLSYGGLCLPKDTQALLQVFKNNNVLHGILSSTIDEHTILRNTDV